MDQETRPAEHPISEKPQSSVSAKRTCGCGCGPPAKEN